MALEEPLGDRLQLVQQIDIDRAVADGRSGYLLVGRRSTQLFVAVLATNPVADVSIG